MKVKRVLSIFISPQVERLIESGIHAITRGPVQVDTYVKIVLPGTFHQVINFVDWPGC